MLDIKGGKVALSNTRLSWLSLVFLTAVVAYADTVQYWFVATDTLPLIETSRMSTLADFYDILTQPLMYGSEFVNAALFYRPISSLSYGVDYAIWELSSSGYHLTNILLHATTALFVALTIAEITTRPPVGYLSAILFAIHPLTASVVPVISRRQDILFSVFSLIALLLFIRNVQENRWWVLAGSGFAYALALGSKETALVLPGLLFAWCAVQQRESRWWPAFIRSASAIGPFLLITVLYLLVRIIVLGGLGGYRDSVASTPGLTILFTPLKYLLWVAQPTAVVESALTGLPKSILILLLIGSVVGSVVLARRTRLRSRLKTSELLGITITGMIFTSTLCVAAFAPYLEVQVPTEMGDASIIVQYLVGSLFIGGCTAGLLSATCLGDRLFDVTIRRQLFFFVIWLLAIPGLLFITGAGIGTPLEVGDQIQTGYFGLIPAMAGLSLLFITSADRLIQTGQLDKFLVNRDTALIVCTVLVVLPLITASPLLQPYDEWEEAGEMNKHTLTEISDELDESPSRLPINIVNLPTVQSENPTLESSIKPLKVYSVKAWLRLQYPAQNREVRIVNEQETMKNPNQVEFRTSRTHEAIVVQAKVN